MNKNEKVASVGAIAGLFSTLTIGLFLVVTVAIAQQCKRSAHSN